MREKIKREHELCFDKGMMGETIDGKIEPDAETVRKITEQLKSRAFKRKTGGESMGRDSHTFNYLAADGYINASTGEVSVGKDAKENLPGKPEDCYNITFKITCEGQIFQVLDTSGGECAAETRICKKEIPLDASNTFKQYPGTVKAVYCAIQDANKYFAEQSAEDSKKIKQVHAHGTLVKRILKLFRGE